jgi:hypothetical protein
MGILFVLVFTYGIALGMEHFNLDSNKANNTPEPSTSFVVSNEDDSSVGDFTKDSKVK